MKRYALICKHSGSTDNDPPTFETDERGAAIARAYQHEAEQCTVRVLDRHTGKDIEL